MQSFSTKEIRHDFEVDGIHYYLPGVRADDFEEIAALGDLEPQDMVIRFADVLAARVQPQRRSLVSWLRREKSARAAVRALNVEQLSALFKEWTGFGRSLGESSGSPSSSETTETN